MFQKVALTKWLVLLFALSLIVSCGNDDNGGVLTGDTLSISFDGGGETTYAERTAGNWAGYDPYVGAQIDTSGPTDSTEIAMTSNFDATSGFFDVGLVLTVAGSAEGVPYDANLGEVTIYYYDFINNRLSNSASSGTVTLTAVGGVGGLIEGTYDLTIVDTSGPVTFSGNFSATRE